MILGFTDSDEVFNQLGEYISELGLTVDRYDFTRPWGGFFVLREEDAPQFAKIFFPEIDFSSIQITQKLSPKFLIVFPGKRLSWQYHFRRAELWKVIQGPVKIAISDTDEEVEPKIFQVGESVFLYQGQRHRLIGDEGVGIVAEIWQHIQEDFPSDEADIVRIQDDFGR